MSATATTPARARHHAAPSASRWTGTAHLVRLALRRDRVRLTVWISVLTAMMLYTPNALELAYPDEAQRRTRVQLLQTPAGIMMGGPMFGRNETDLGAMMANELMLTLIVATSILAILTVIRHTRAEEEGGTAELVLASPVGRYARTTAALLVVGTVNAVIAVTMTAAMAASGFAVADTAAMCIGVTAVATVFGAVAAVTAQLWRVARTASGAAMALLALAALIRGVGDVIDHSGSALSWFSPIAWAQQMRAFVDLRWWPLALLLVVTVLLIALAAVLEARRQYDDGILATSGERPGAKPIRGVIGLHLVLQRGSLIGWTVGLFLAGLAFGSMTKSLRDAAQTNELIARMLAAQGNDGIYTTMSQFLAAAAAAYVTTAVLRVYADEQAGLGESVLAGAVSRWSWLVGAVVTAVLGGAVSMFFAGLGN
ncbi:MAG: ABC transporter, partial [Mycobacterium sp.]|nr:ABC transporter [Mycobacterium sp.]